MRGGRRTHLYAVELRQTEGVGEPALSFQDRAGLNLATFVSRNDQRGHSAVLAVYCERKIGRRTMQSQHVAAATALLTLMTGAAFAQGGYPSENARGWYIGAGIGLFDVKVDGLDSIDEAIDDHDAEDMSWKIFTGYRFNPYISLEA